jgi:hypothetical protein
MALQKRRVAGETEEVTVTGNGQTVTVARGTLLVVLHEQWRLHGTRGGCGEGRCGYCGPDCDGGVFRCPLDASGLLRRDGYCTRSCGKPASSRACMRVAMWSGPRVSMVTSITVSPRLTP